MHQGRSGAGRHVIGLASVAYAARLAGQLPLATRLYRRALSLAEHLVSGGLRGGPNDVDDDTNTVNDIIAPAAAVAEGGGGKVDGDDGVGACDVRLAQVR